MTQLEVFFDYACPYCLKGYEDLISLLPGYPQIQVLWRPCEAHPRPDSYGPHSDLCIQGMYFAQDQGIPLAAYHELMYRAALIDRINIEDIDTLSAYAGRLLDAAAFRSALQNGLYRQRQLDANHYAFRQSGVWVVPAYRMNGYKLDSIEDVGVPLNKLKAFLDKVT